MTVTQVLDVTGFVAPGSSWVSGLLEVVVGLMVTDCVVTVVV